SEGDRRGIAKLTDALAEVEAHEFVLVSTIDVYPDPASGDDEDSAIDPSANHAYGRNRYELECWVREHFPLCRIVRLPALFGEGLRKNALFDLLHGNRTEAINPAGVFQWYPLRRLHDDLERVRAADLRLVNLFTQPFATQEVVDAFFPGARVGPPSRPAARYDLRTKHNAELGGQRGYLLDTTTVLGEMAQYVSGERRGRSAAAEAGARG
ncbi:MAG: hypothetical protein KY444_10490, partial [Gemmatimonadetes bacterium]|nr:hypothetical protein [Gemmatimonadota bacterium]